MLTPQLTAIEQKRTALSDEREHLLARLGIETVDEVQAGRIERVVGRVRDRLERLTPQEQFDAVHAVVSRIVVHRDSRIEIDACIPLGGGDAERATLVIASVPSSRRGRYDQSSRSPSKSDSEVRHGSDGT